MKEVIIIGAGGHGRVIADAVKTLGDRILGFLDDNKALSFTLGVIDDFKKFPDAHFILAIGNNSVRKKLAEKMEQAMPVHWYTVIHPSSVVSPTAKIGAGSVVLPNAVVNAGVTIGAHGIVNTGALLGRDSSISNYVHVAVGAKVGEHVTIKNGSTAGIGSIFADHVTIGENCLIGAGAIVPQDITEPGTYVGQPAKKLQA